MSAAILPGSRPPPPSCPRRREVADEMADAVISHQRHVVAATGGAPASDRAGMRPHVADVRAARRPSAHSRRADQPGSLGWTRSRPRRVRGRTVGAFRGLGWNRSPAARPESVTLRATSACPFGRLPLAARRRLGQCSPADSGPACGFDATTGWPSTHLARAHREGPDRAEVRRVRRHRRRRHWGAASPRTRGGSSTCTPPWRGAGSTVARVEAKEPAGDALASRVTNPVVRQASPAWRATRRKVAVAAAVSNDRPTSHPAA